eukprot:3353159-Alexandrium_andersonii.AAC.1
MDLRSGPLVEGPAVGLRQRSHLRSSTGLGSRNRFRHKRGPRPRAHARGSAGIDIGRVRVFQGRTGR